MITTSEAEGVIFDLDGTLIDSDDLNFAALVAALQPTGITIERSWFNDRVGLASPDMIAELVALKGAVVNVAAIMAARDRFFLGHLGRLRLFTDTVTSLRDAYQAGHRTAVATGAGRAIALPVLARFGLAKYLDVIVTRDDVIRGKPFPDLFIHAAALLKVPQRKCMVYEDTEEGIAAGIAADMVVLDVRLLRACSLPNREMLNCSDMSTRDRCV